MMDPVEPISERQSAILELVKKTGFATIAELSETFYVTTQTIRRDVNALCTAQALARFHGGVGLPNSVQNEDYSNRREVLATAKNAIGSLVRTIVPNDASLFMNIGTTTEAVAKHLRDHQRLRVVTNNIHIADMFAKIEGFDVMVAGGHVRGSDGGVVGEAAIDFLNGFKLDFGIIGISGIDPDGSLLDFDYREVRAAQTIIANARSTILVADHTKFGRPAMAKVASIHQVDVLVTDQPIPEAFADMVTAAGVEVLVPASVSQEGSAKTAKA
ncbi:MAG: DeoR/GlpR family DNA-binding transcription regulator [Pseudomonadota bacterium]